MILSPCKDCERSGCGVYHDQCEKYLEYKAAKKKEKAAYDADVLRRTKPVNPYLKKKLKERSKGKYR